MKTKLLLLSAFVIVMSFTSKVFAQTQGTLSFSVTPVAQSGGYGNKHVLAIWIQNNSGTFVKTKMRYWGNGTDDHLPTWKTNSNSNITDASTGATLTSYATRTITWDGKNSSGVEVADGQYKIMIEECWGDGSTKNVTKSYTFTKGPSVDSQTPANDSKFTNATLTWTPLVNAIEDVENDEITVFPNPSNGIINVNFKQASEIKIVNITGKVIYQENIKNNITKSKSIDMANFANGIYFVNIINGEKSTVKKIVLNK